MKVILIIALLCAFIVCQIPSGFKISLSQHGLDYIRTVGTQIIHQRLQGLRIPDQVGQDGSIQYQVTNIAVFNVRIPHTAAQIIPNSGIAFGVGGLHAEVSLHWRFKRTKFPKISGSGTAHAIFDNTGVNVDMGIATENARPKVVVRGAHCGIGGFKLNVKSKHFNIIYKLLVALFKNKIKRMIEKEVLNNVVIAINGNLNNILQSMKVVQNIPKANDVAIDYGMIANPGFTNFITLRHRGEFYNSATGYRCGHCVIPSIPDVAHPRMAQIILSDFLLNSAADVFRQRGNLRHVLLDQNLPSWAPFRLTTTALKDKLPALYEKWPNQYLKVTLEATHSPVFTITPQGISIYGNKSLLSGATVLTKGVLKVFVLLGGTELPVFTLELDVTCSAAAFFVGNDRIGGKLTYLHMNSRVIESVIGKFDTKIFNDAINAMFAKGFVPFINFMLQDGFPLPSIPYINLVNPVISYGNHYIAVATDIHYTG